MLSQAACVRMTQEARLIIPGRPGKGCLLQVVATAEVVVVSLDEAYRPRRLPGHVLQLLLSGQPSSSAEGPTSWT
jgi:acyl-CoA thioesterase FadM